MKRKTILLTGATGSVGKLIRPLLLARYDLRLTGRGEIGETSPGETYEVADLCDAAAVDRLVRGVDGVIHLAGLVAPGVSFTETLGPNYRAVLNVLEAMRSHGVNRHVFASSHHIIGMLPSDRAWETDAPVAPDSYYGLSKAFGEAACAMFAFRYGMRTLVVRIGNADPQIVDGRRERIWTSGRDLADLIACGLEDPDLTYAIVNGVSACDDPLLGLGAAEGLGYRPQDRSADHRASDFKPYAALSEEEGRGYVGGFFAKRDLPNAN